MNRKQRRQNGTESPNATTNDIEVPLARPDYDSKPQTKTLYELASERQAALSGKSTTQTVVPSKENVVNVAIGPNGEIRSLDGSALPDQAAVVTDSPWLDTLLLAISLSALHFTLEALTIHQYADELNWTHVFWHTVLKAFPILTLLIHFMHGHLVSVPMSKEVADAVGGVKQLVFLAVANVTGCYLIYLTNDEGYMAVMKNAPSIGTVWVWSIIELGLLGALLGVAGPGIYAYYRGYGIF